MEQLEELEESFLYEIKPFIDTFVEIRKQPLDLEARMKSVGIRKLVQRKTDEFRERYTEAIKAEIKGICDKKADILATGEDLKKLRDKILEIHELKIVCKEKGDEEKYAGLAFTEMEKKSEFDKMRKQCKEKIELYKSSDENRLVELKKKQKDFQEKYGDMDKITETELYRLDVFIGNKEKENQIIMEDGEVKDEEGNKVKNIEAAIELQKRVDEQIEEELKRIEHEKIQTVLDQTKQEYEEYTEQKMQEPGESIDKELEEMEETKKQEEKAQQAIVQDDKVKGHKNRFWQRIKSFFRRKVVPALIETINVEGEESISQQAGDGENEDNNGFKERIAEGSPSQEQQAETTKEIVEEKKPEKPNEKEIEEVLSMLDE